jgi:hypothetical protein
MKPLARKLLILGIAMFVVLPAGWSEVFNYASYTPTTLQEIITEEQNQSFDLTEAEQEAVDLQLECRVAKYRVPCRYSNIRRPISEKKKNAIKLWMETLGIDPNFASLYRQEIQVTEGMNVHWIPVQEKLFPHINQELVKDDAIELFIVFMGKAESEHVIIATEFEKSLSSGKKSIKATAYKGAAP